MRAGQPPPPPPPSLPLPQGMIKHTLMALSEAGTQADVDIVQDHYAEEWWLQALLAMDPFHGIWHRQFFSHNSRPLKPFWTCMC